MDVFEAINKMREKTERRESFSFAFMSFSYERRKSNGIVKIERARLRKQSRIENNRFADYMCWQPLLLEFDGNDLELR